MACRTDGEHRGLYTSGASSCDKRERLYAISAFNAEKARHEVHVQEVDRKLLLLVLLLSSSDAARMLRVLVCRRVRPASFLPAPKTCFRSYATKAPLPSELELNDGSNAPTSSAPRRQRRASATQKAELIVQRPTVKSFSKAGLGKDIAKHLQDFPHALLLCRVGQFYEVCLLFCCYLDAC